MFSAGKDEGRSRALGAVRALARDLLGAGEDDVVVVNELRCLEPGCPPIETIIALLRKGQPTRQVKLHKPAVEITAEELRAALQPDAGPHAHPHDDAPLG